VTRIQPVADAFGVVRGGPRRAWWTHLRPRLFNGIGISYEIPQWRLRAWNVAFIAAEVGLAVWAHSSGMSWADIAGEFTGLFAAGAGWVFGALPVLTYRADLRHAADVARWQADAALVEAEVERRHFKRYGVDISRVAYRAAMQAAGELAPERELVAA
jgi:hypothetical protein